MKEDANTGMNTATNAKKLFDYLDSIGSYLDQLIVVFDAIARALETKQGLGGGGKKPPYVGPNLGEGLNGPGGPGSYQSILSQITNHLKNIDINTGNILQKLINPEEGIPTNELTVIPGEGVKTHEQFDKTNHEVLSSKRQAQESKLQLERFEAEQAAILAEKEAEAVKQQAERDALKTKLEKLTSGEIESTVGQSTITTSPVQSVFGMLKKALNISSDKINLDDISATNREQQGKLLAKRRKEYGFADTINNPTNTGDAARVYRSKFLWRHNQGTNPENNPFRGLKITPGVDVDYKGINDALQSAIEKNQFEAQTGGGFFKQMWGVMSLYAGQDSIEKSRAQADGLNEVMAIMKDAISDLVDSIKVEENTLREMEKSGDAVFNDKGVLTDKSSNEAFVTAIRMEELKLGLQGVLAEAEKVDDIVNALGGNTSKIIKRLEFAAPELQKCNKVLRNINSGLDKNGKALKFQKRIQEILNYSYQLMGRHVGQMIKNWMMMLNPINAIKKAFSDFTSYSPKWQRTMNVIKYNLRDIILPIMDKIAQLLVNMIGFVDIILQKVQAAFGNTPISLFDQENADKVKKTYEDMYEVSAGFDELHDIGSSASENNPDNLLGEIYKPQLSQEWIDLANEIGDLFAGVITGDLGFSEAMGKILKIAWDGIKTLWNEILWPFMKNTIWPAIKDNVLELLAWVAATFLAWKFLKWVGSTLLQAVFGKFTSNAGASALSKLFDENGVTALGKKIGLGIAGAILTVVSAMALGDAINDAWSQGKSDANTGKNMNLTDKQTGMDALQGALGGAGVVLGGGMIAAALGASVALGPLVAVAAGVAALAAVVVVGAEAWAYHSQQNKIANNEMLAAEDYAEQAATAEQELIEIKNLVANATQIQNTNQEKLNQLEKEYGITLEEVNQKVELAGGNTDVLTTKEKALYDQGIITQESVKNYNRLLEIQIELQKKSLWAKEQEAIALNMEAGEYELAALRIEQAELQGLITTEEATAKRIQLYKECGESERENLLQNLAPEHRELMLQYRGVTEKERKELQKIYDKMGEETREALLEGVGPETQREFDRRMNSLTNTLEKHHNIWQGIGDTLKEIVTLRCLGYLDL